MSLRSDLINALYDENQKYDVCGIISAEGKISPLGSDTKVLSTIFELFSRPIINKIAEKHGYIVEEPKQQNHYPDFTLYKPSEPNKKIAIDIKTTYTNKENEKIKFTLGGYTSFIRNNTKNIVYPFDQYIAHWIIGYVYTRVATRKSSLKTYNINELNEIPKPYKGVKVFLQDKWVIAGDLAGSGNTTNIGSIHAHYKDFVEGKGIFDSEDEFLDYWRNYERTSQLRNDKYNNISEYRNWIYRGRK